jgi:hypothetical protein
MMMARAFPNLFAYQFVFECCPDGFNVSISRDDLFESSGILEREAEFTAARIGIEIHTIPTAEGSGSPSR